MWGEGGLGARAGKGEVGVGEGEVVVAGGDGAELARGVGGGFEGVGEEEAPDVAVVADALGDAGDAGDEGGGEGVGEEERGVVLARADFGGDELGAEDAAGALDVELVDEWGLVEEGIDAGAGERADEAAREGLADEFEGWGGHGHIADPAWEDDEEAEGFERGRGFGRHGGEGSRSGGVIVRRGFYRSRLSIIGLFGVC